MANLTDAQIARTLELALGWRHNGNILAAKIRLSALRKRLHGAQRDHLDHELRRRRFLETVIEADSPVGRAANGKMPGKNGGADGVRGWC